MKWNQIIWTLLVVAGSLNLVSSQATPARVLAPEVSARVGSSTNFTCDSYGVPINLCLWEREKRAGVKDVLLSFNTPESKLDRYSYAGSGLDKGECGLAISSVQDVDGAVWNCKLFATTGQIYSGDVRLNILKKPTNLAFDRDVNVIKQLRDSGNNQPTKVTVTCGSKGGQPPPKYKWFLDDKEITEGLQPYVNRTGSDGIISTHQELRDLALTWKDNRKNLKCVVVHDALSESDITRGLNQVSETIQIKFSPRVEALNSPFFVPSLGETAELAVNVSANPQPLRNDAEWLIDQKRIFPGQQSQDKRYKAFNPVQVFPDVWEFKLQITDVEEEDLGKVYQLRVKNELSVGKFSEFDLRITASNPEAGGMSAGGIVGLVLGIPALLIIIAVIVVYTRARGLLCFKGDDGTASEKERMDGESGGGTEEKPAPRKLSSRLSAIYENLVSKKKDKTAPVEEEVPKEKESKETSDPTSQEKKPDDIVYAELDLVNEGAGGKPVIRGTEDKTEYAEIIGVVPQQATSDSSKKDKSPTGSNKSSPKK